MARNCEQCDRGPLSSVSRSHSNVATKRRQFVNLQWKRVGQERKRLCTRCIKLITKTAASV